jgi:hypothetical protein
MKKIITDTKSLAALLMAGAAFAACSSEDNMIGGQPASQQTYTMTIEATKGGDSATTRALALDGKTLNATWETSNEVKAYNHTQSSAFTGSLKPQSSGVSATLTGSLTGSVAVGNIIYLRWPSVDADYTGQDGTLATIAQRYDYTTGIAKVTSVDGTTIGAEDSSHGGPVLFTNSQAIVKFTLIDKATDAPIRATQLTIDAKVNGGSRLIQSLTYPDAYTIGPITIDRTSPADNVVYAALPFSSQADFTFALTATDGTHNYTYEKAGMKMINGRYYEVKVKMTRATYPITLSEVTSGNLGSVVTTDGTVYATVADASAANKTAAGMIAYVSGIGQGLAIALADETSAMNWNTAITTAAAHTPAVTGYSWRLPNLDEWKQMFSANGNNEGSYTGLNTAITNAGGVALQDGGAWYWSITEHSDSKACYVDLRNNAATFGAFIKVGDTSNLSVRACLAFGPARGHALASSAVGEIVGSDGLAYYASDKNNLPSGVTAVAMIAYKSETAGESLAIQLNASPASKNWSDACNYSNYPSITGNPGNWRLPSMADWQNMFVGCAKSGDAGASDYMDPIAGFKEKIGATGITWQSDDPYWSSSTGSGSNAWLVLVNLYGRFAVAGFVEYGTSDPNLVLGCLAF